MHILAVHSPTGRTQYSMLLNEMQGKRGVFSTHSWDGTPLEEPYCPPWRQTLTDLYGPEAYAKMHAPVEEYEARSSRFAREEAERRLAGSRAKLRGGD